MLAGWGRLRAEGNEFKKNDGVGHCNNHMFFKPKVISSPMESRSVASVPVRDEPPWRIEAHARKLNRLLVTALNEAAHTEVVTYPGIHSRRY